MANLHKEKQITFRRIGGRIVPVKNRNYGGPTENKNMTRASRVLTVSGAALAGIGVGLGAKKFALTGAAALGLEATALGLAFGAHQGKGRVRRGAKSEAKNQALGWSVFGATALGFPRGRRAILGNLKKVGKLVKRG